MKAGDPTMPYDEPAPSDSDPPLFDSEVERLRAEIARIQLAQSERRRDSLRRRLRSRLRRRLRGRRRYAP
jgi:hypothetical protein